MGMGGKNGNGRGNGNVRKKWEWEGKMTCTEDKFCKYCKIYQKSQIPRVSFWLHVVSANGN